MTEALPHMPLVSVVIPVHNGERFLGEALRSVQEQGYPALEVLVVDDGSTDGSAAVAAAFPEPVRYLRQSRAGPAAARNRGIETARGEVVALLDADDVWPAGALRARVDHLLAHPEAEIVQGLVQQLRARQDAPGFEPWGEPYQYVNLGSAVYRRAVFERVGPFDESLWENEDNDFFLRAWEHRVVKHVLDQVALLYRRHNGNMSPDDQHFSLVRVFKKHLDRVRARGAPRPRRGFPHVGQYIGEVPIAGAAPRLGDIRWPA
jgi:glycosyltransferase involved in cell wall biosynthesis